jgi:hypothetical protein
MCTCAWITLVIQTVFASLAASYGFGKHRNELPTEAFPIAMFYFYLLQICYMVLGTFTKLTFCFLYLRLFGTHEPFRTVLKATTTITIAGGIIFTFANIWRCVPVQLTWDDRTRGGHCAAYTPFWFSHATFSTVLDLTVLILPLPQIHRLHLAAPSKLSLTTLFSLGAFVTAASMARMVFLRTTRQTTADPTWERMPVLTWTQIESNTALIVCCLPALGACGAQTWRRITVIFRGRRAPSSEAAAAPPPDSHGSSSSSHNNNNNPRKPPNPHRESFSTTLGQPHGPPSGLGNFTHIRYSPRSSRLLSRDDDGLARAEAGEMRGEVERGGAERRMEGRDARAGREVGGCVALAEFLRSSEPPGLAVEEEDQGREDPWVERTAVRGPPRTSGSSPSGWKVVRRPGGDGLVSGAEGGRKSDGDDPGLEVRGGQPRGREAGW